jgi:hypothetical protein
VLRMEGWAAKGGEMDRETKGRTRHNWTGLRTGLVYVRQNAEETIQWTICRIIGTRCNDIQRQKRLAEIRKISLLCLYREQKLSWGRGMYTSRCSVKERMAEVGNLQNERSEGGTEGRKCRLCGGQNATCLLVQCTTHNGGVSSY